MLMPFGIEIPQIPSTKIKGSEQQQLNQALDLLRTGTNALNLPNLPSNLKPANVISGIQNDMKSNSITNTQQCVDGLCTKISSASNGTVQVKPDAAAQAGQKKKPWWQKLLDLIMLLVALYSLYSMVSGVFNYFDRKGSKQKADEDISKQALPPKEQVSKQALPPSKQVIKQTPESGGFNVGNIKLTPATGLAGTIPIKAVPFISAQDLSSIGNAGYSITLPNVVKTASGAGGR
jgi:hypothetical protein